MQCRQAGLCWNNSKQTREPEFTQGTAQTSLDSQWKVSKVCHPRKKTTGSMKEMQPQRLLGKMLLWYAEGMQGKQLRDWIQGGSLEALVKEDQKESVSSESLSWTTTSASGVRLGQNGCPGFHLSCLPSPSSLEARNCQSYPHLQGYKETIEWWEDWQLPSLMTTRLKYFCIIDVFNSINSLMK